MNKSLQTLRKEHCALLAVKEGQSTKVLLTWKKRRGDEPGVGEKEQLLTGLAMYSGLSAKDSGKQKVLSRTKADFSCLKDYSDCSLRMD